MSLSQLPGVILIASLCLLLCVYLHHPCSDPAQHVAVPAQHVAVPSAIPWRRQVYFDLGANWANTLRLYEEVVELAEIEHDDVQWEVYGFEASPFVQPYLEEFVRFLNGERPEPQLLWPPTGSSAHLKHFRSCYGCGGRDFRECIYSQIREDVERFMNPTPFLTADVAEFRLQGLLNRQRLQGPHFVHVPAAVCGGSNKTIHLQGDRLQVIRGGSLPSKGNTYDYAVQCYSFAELLQNANLLDRDLVVVKMDVEGAEHDIVDDLVRTGLHRLIDVFIAECHGECTQWWKRVNELPWRVLRESKEFPGWDSHSKPSDVVKKLRCPSQ